MKKYITPAVECYEFELVQLVASSNQIEISNESADTGYDGGADARGNQNNNSNMWNNAW